jgi:hypothetical protein
LYTTVAHTFLSCIVSHPLQFLIDISQSVALYHTLLLIVSVQLLSGDTGVSLNALIGYQLAGLSSAYICAVLLASIPQQSALSFADIL